MSRYIHGRLERLQGRIRAPESQHMSDARAQMVEHLNRIADARRSGTWTDEDARQRGAVRAETIRRRGGGGP
jgi:hypothetical protein